MNGAFDDVLAANEAYAGGFQLGGLDGRAARGLLAVLTCMDSRIEPLRMLGLEPGDAKILRNAGARVTDDVLRTPRSGDASARRRPLHGGRPHAVPHGRRGGGRRARGGAPRGRTDTRNLAFLVARDQETTVRDDVQRVRSSPYLAGLAVGASPTTSTRGACCSSSELLRLAELVREEIHEQPVAPRTVGRPLIPPHHAHRAEAGLLVGSDRPRVRCSGVDGQPMVPKVVDKVPREHADGLRAEPAAVHVAGEEEVEGRVAVLGVCSS